MGDWNETCAISKLTIRGGEKVRLLPIAMNPWHIQAISGLPEDIATRACYSGASGCYTKDLYTPICYPIRGYYNTYGSIDRVPDKTLRDKAEIEQFTQAFKQLCVPLPLGENEYHDTPLQEFTLEEILAALEEGRCFINYRSLSNKAERLVPVSCMMIKESIWQSLLKLDLNVSDSLYEKHPLFKDYSKIVKKKIDIFLLRSYIYSNKNTISAEKRADLIIKLMDLQDEIKYDELIFWHHSPFKEPALNKNLLTIAAECDYIDTALSLLRINYAPTTGSGSQATNVKLWKAVYPLWNKIR